jgi:C4-dicarboxylate transporter
MIVGVLFIIFFASAVATMMGALFPLGLARGLGAYNAAAVVAWTAAILVSYAGAGVAATAQAVIFRQLTGWRDGMPSPLEKIA